jgi:formamidopyrimidine-DNA glycosylase
MPELPEVQTVVQGLKQNILGKTIKEISFGKKDILKSKPSILKNSLLNQKIVAVTRRGKNILMVLSNKKVLLIHLGMTGHFSFVSDSNLLDKHTHFVIKLKNEKKELRYHDIRRFGKIKLLNSIDDLDNLGKEPLIISFPEFVEIFKKKKGKIKSFLLNQKHIAGIGNIYADEILFSSKVHPERKVESLKSSQLEKIFISMQKILKKAIQAGGSTIENYMDVDGEKGFFQLQHKAYGKEGKPCPNCKNKIKRIKVNQRSTYFCPQCQK